VLTDQQSGDVDVTCLREVGDALYSWDSSEGSTGTWYVDVEVYAWGNFYFVYGQTTTNTFVLW
jgi:hypothetical protein